MTLTHTHRFELPVQVRVSGSNPKAEIILPARPSAKLSFKQALISLASLTILAAMAPSAFAQDNDVDGYDGTTTTGCATAAITAASTSAGGVTCSRMSPLRTLSAVFKTLWEKTVTETL